MSRIRTFQHCPSAIWQCLYGLSEVPRLDLSKTTSNRSSALYDIDIDIDKNEKERVSMSAQQEIDAILATKRIRPKAPPEYFSHEEWGSYLPVRYRPGVIIRAANILSKTRQAIVVDTTTSSYTVLPILTHNGQGLANMPERFKHEYLGICDHREGGWYQPQNNMPVLLTEKMMGYLVPHMSTVQYTRPVVMQYEQQTVLHGQLRHHSTQTLLEHYRYLPSRLSVRDAMLLAE